MKDDRADDYFVRAGRSLRTSTYGSDAAIERVLRAINDERSAPQIPALSVVRSRSSRHITRIAAAAIFAAGLGLGATFGWRAHGDNPVRGNTVDAPMISVPAPAQLAAPTTVLFTLAASGAQQVSLVGEFNAWDAKATPMHRTTNGEWQVRVLLKPGRHLYAFLVDSNGWVTDPHAPLSPERWYGSRNSVLIVNRPLNQ